MNAYIFSRILDLPCCKHARNQNCRQTCESVLKIGETMQEIIDALEQGDCGPPMPHEPLWQCFLSDQKTIQPTSTDGETKSQISQFGMDSAKLHCCHKAVAPKCRRLCIQTFSSEWTDTRIQFDIDCYGQLNEVALTQCLDEGSFHYFVTVINFELILMILLIRFFHVSS